jgi:CDP-diacylglycerol---serine O-phosphatidyltransferase
MIGKRPRLIAAFPTMLTLGNGACGFACITFSAKVGPEPTDANHLLIAALFIFLGMLFDALDGSAARLTNQTSEFGAELDSLCDAITFGVAPAFLMLQFSREYHGRLLWVCGVLYLLCALLRLARFNVETDEEDDHDAFSGLPSPAAASVVASFPLAMRGAKDLAANNEALAQHVGEWLVPAMMISLPFFTLAVAFLMVSRFRYPHVFNQLLKQKRSRRQVVQMVFGVVFVYAVRELAIPILFCYFAFATPIASAWKELLAGRLYKSKKV